MTDRTRTLKVMNETKGDENQFLIFYELDNTYSVVPRKNVITQGELTLGSTVKVKDGPNCYIGHIMNIGKQEDLEKVAEIRNRNSPVPSDCSRNAKSSESPLTSKRTSLEREIDSDDDCLQIQPKKKGGKRPKKTPPSSLESDDEGEVELSAYEKERARVSSFMAKLPNLSAPPLPRLSSVLPQPGTSSSSCGCRDVLKQLEERIAKLENAMASQTHNSQANHHHEESLHPAAEPARPDIKILHNGFNLMNITAPPKEPNKCALKLMDKLFSPMELQHGILFKTSRSNKQPLDADKVEKLFDVLSRKYSPEKIEKARGSIVEACNQKCRDALRAYKISKQHEENNN